MTWEGMNVWQWCEDWYDPTEQGRVLRGAWWYSGDRDSLLASFCSNVIPDSRGVNVGFRCVVGAESSR
jgi:formylglycine-generating enzyme required for sulfatase activity